jgi:hypothetical protein
MCESQILRNLTGIGTSMRGRVLQRLSKHEPRVWHLHNCNAKSNGGHAVRHWDKKIPQMGRFLASTVAWWPLSDWGCRGLPILFTPGTPHANHTESCRISMENATSCDSPAASCRSELIIVGFQHHERNPFCPSPAPEGSGLQRERNHRPRARHLRRHGLLGGATDERDRNPNCARRAGKSSIFRLVVGQAMMLVAISLGIGLVGAFPRRVCLTACSSVSAPRIRSPLSKSCSWSRRSHFWPRGCQPGAQLRSIPSSPCVPNEN